MKVKTFTTFLVKDADDCGTYPPTGYSEYNDRFYKKQKGLLPAGEEIYGYQQALEHAMEIKMRTKHAVLSIATFTTVETSIPFNI